MKDISTLYPYPKTANSGTPPLPYDEKQPLKNWIAKGTMDPFVYVHVDTDPKTGAIEIKTNSIGAALARTLNMPPVGFIYPPGVIPNSASIPIPVDLALLPPGATIVPNPLANFGELPLIKPAATTLTDSQKIQSTLDIVTAIARKVGV